MINSVLLMIVRREIELKKKKVNSHDKIVDHETYRYDSQTLRNEEKIAQGRCNPSSREY